MLSSPSLMCRTPTQGQHQFCCSSESTPPRSPGGALNIFTKDTVVSQSKPSPASAVRSMVVEPCSPTKQPSPLRMTAFPANSHTSNTDNDKLPPSPTSRYTLESLQKKKSKMSSLTGDKMDRGSAELSQQPPGAWYMRRNRIKTVQCMAAQTSPTGAVSPTKQRPHSGVAPPPTAAPIRSPFKVISPASASRFSFFNMTSLKSPDTTSSSAPKDDELANLDINTALFPNGAPKDGETFSPAAFKNLQTNATGLLRRFQSAYKDKAIACWELRAERDAQQDEKIETETRTTHLKMQLENMAQKAAETEASMQGLMEELNREKKLRMEERTSRESGVISSRISTISEDLGAEDDQRKNYHRQSAGTTKSDDGGFDTDEESVDEVSVFSQPRSPTLAACPMDGASIHSAYNTAPVPQVTRSAMLEPPRPSRQSQPQQISAFQKLFKGISGETSAKGCQNCKGQDTSVAWDTASLLRDENRGLKQRVGDLEAAVEEALDIVMGVKLQHMHGHEE